MTADRGSRRDARRPPSGVGAPAAPRRAASAAAASPGASPTFRPADPDAPVRFAVDLLDVDESRIAPGDAAALDGAGQPAASPGARRSRDRHAATPATRPNARDELWIPIVLVALLVLTLEWLVYERDTLARLRRAAGARRRPRRAARGQGRLMGISLRRPARAAAAAAAARRWSSRCTWRRGAGWAWAGGARRSSSGCSLLSALVVALAGLQLVLPVDRLAVVYVVDLSDSVGTAGREEALAYLRESLAAQARTRTSRGSSRSAATRSWSGCPAELAEIDRIASTPGQGRDRHRRGAPPRRRALPGRRPEADRPALGRQRHDRAPARPRRRSRRPAGSRSRRT